MFDFPATHRHCETGRSEMIAVDFAAGPTDGATELIRRGARRATVQALLGNKTRVMTDRYIHLTEDDAAQALTHGPGEKPGFVIDFVIDDEERASGEGR